MRVSILALLAASTMLAPPAFAAGAPGDAAPDAAPEATPEPIVVVGHGETRQVQELRVADVAIETPGTSPLKIAAVLPSVNFQSADPFGNYEWSERITIRGFNQNQIGFNLDGVPLGDFSYGNTNGLHISRAIASENIETVRVNQGAGALGTQATNNLGGTIQFASRAPRDSFGITVNGTYGSFNTVRPFVRIDTGDLGGGVKGWVSYGYLGMDKWKGFGQQRQHMVNAKLVIPAGAGSLTGYFDFSDRRENDYQDLSLAMINTPGEGYGLDNISNNFPLAVLISQIGANQGYTGAPVTNPGAGTVLPAPFKTPDDAYFDAAGLRRDYLGRVTYDAPLTDALKLKLSAYYHSNHGQGIWFTPYVYSPSGVPISVRTTEYDIRRGGGFGSLDWKMDGNALTVGAWYEGNSFHQARRYYGLDSLTASTRDSLSFQANPFFTQWEFKYATETFQYYVQDKLDLGALTVNLGWKGFSVTERSNPIVQGSFAGANRIRVSDWFQPSVGAVYKLGGGAEVFADFARSTRALAAATTGLSWFSTNATGFAALLQSGVKPEQSDTYEAGLRLSQAGLSASLTGYLVNFRNRLLGLSTGAGIVGNPTILQNVGGVRSAGVEAVMQYRIIPPVRVLVSYAYDRSTYQDDVTNLSGVVVAAIKGKSTVDAPQHMFKASLGYDDHHLIAEIAADYMSKRYFTYTNDQSVPGRWLANATLGYRFGDALMLKGLELQGNVTNLFNERYVATIGSNGFGNSGDNQTLLAGAPRAGFVTLKAGF